MGDRARSGKNSPAQSPSPRTPGQTLPCPSPTRTATPKACLYRTVVVGVAQRGHPCLTQIFQVTFDPQYQFPELRCPTRVLFRRCHEAPMVMDRPVHGRLEIARNMEHARTPVRKPAGTVRSGAGEGRHQVACARTADPSPRRNQVEIADRIHQPPVGLLLRRDQKPPVVRFGYVFEVIDRGIGTADDPDRTRPVDERGGNIHGPDHQAPRSASR